MRGFHHHGHHHYGNFGRHGGPWKGLVWLFAIGAFMLGAPWWPVILILAGVGLVFAAIWSASAGSEVQPPAMPPFQPAPPPARPAVPPVFERMPAAPRPAPYQPAPAPIELLPAACPRCGGPVRSPEVRWRGERFAACAYCGSNLITSKTARS